MQWLEVERADPDTALLPMGACEARFGTRFAGEQQGVLSRDEPVEICASGATTCGYRGGSTGSPGMRLAPGFGSSTTRPARLRDEKSGQLQGGRMLQLPLYMLAGGELLGIDPRAARPRTSTRRAAAGSRRSTGARETSRAGTTRSSGVLDAIVDGDRARRLHRRAMGRGQACRYCAFDAICPTRRGRRTSKRKANDERLARVRRPRSGASNERAASTQAAREPDRAATSTRTSASRPAPAPARRPCSSTRVVERCSRAGVVDVDELVVITFTEKAAAELSTRVRDELERRARTARRARNAARLLDAARDLYRAHIETIHASPQRCCASGRSRPGSTRCSRCSTGSPARLVVRRRLRALPGRAAVASRGPRSSARCAAGSGWRSCARRASASTQHRYLLPLAIPDVDRRPSPTRRSPRLREIADELRALLRRHQPPGEDKAIAIVEGIDRMGRRASRRSTAERARARAALPTSRRTRNSDAGSHAELGRRRSSACEELQQAYSETRRRGSAGAAHRGAARPAAARRAVRPRLRARAPRRRRRRLRRPAVLGARPAARQPSRRAATSAAGSRCVLIDEFQDTDPVQAELALLLTSDDRARRRTGGRSARRPGG